MAQNLASPVSGVRFLGVENCREHFIPKWRYKYANMYRRDHECVQAITVSVEAFQGNDQFGDAGIFEPTDVLSRSRIICDRVRQGTV